MDAKDENIICEPTSRIEIREFANWVRKLLGMQDLLYFPIEKILDDMSYKFNFDYIIQEDTEFPQNVYATTCPTENMIYLRKTIYIDAVNGGGLGRMTIAHEIGHLLLFKEFGINYHRSFSEYHKAYEDPEWQAKCFAGELLMNYDLTANMTAEEISEKCGVTLEAAEYRRRY